MGSLDLRPYVVTLEQLCAEAEAIALVRPEGALIVEEHLIGEAPRPDRPTAPQVRYAWAWEPHTVLRWLRRPDGTSEQIQIGSASNAASARDAQDAASGLLGHVHHVVPQPRLEGLPAEWVLGPQGERIAFLRAAHGARWEAIHQGLSLTPLASPTVEALLRPPTTPPRPWWRFWR